MDPLISLSVLIDQRVLSYLDLLSAYHSRALSLASTMTQAHVHLSQSKYIMGAHRLGRLQYDQRMQPTLHSVVVEGGENVPAVRFIHTPIPFLQDDAQVEASPIEPSMSRRRGGHGYKDSNSFPTPLIFPPTLDDISTTSLLKKSSEAQDDGVELKPVHAGSHSRSASANAAVIRDPITWFGVLVPPSLRAAQKEFRNVLVDAVGLANLRIRMIVLEEEIRRLLEEKKQMMEALGVRVDGEEAVDEVDSGEELDRLIAGDAS